MAIEMRVKGLMVDPLSNMPIIILRSRDEATVLPIWVGVFEANAIAMQLERIVSPRPMTHDLLTHVIGALDARVERVVITDLRENTFFAILHLVRDGKPLEVDARPSDAMALALRTHAPIYVEETVLEKSSLPGDDKGSEETERLRRWLESVDPKELGKYQM